MPQIAIQLRDKDTSSHTLKGPKVMAFGPALGLTGILEATINEHQLEAISDALKNLPYKIDRTGKGTDYVSFNGANW